MGIGGLIDVVFPRFCLRCGEEGSVWCGACASTYRPFAPVARCPFCEVEGSNRTCEVCQKETYLDGLFACAAYGNPIVREALTSWKYHADPHMGYVVKSWIEQATEIRTGLKSLGSFRTGLTSLGSFQRDFSPVWSVTHVPLHASRRRHRGFDQAEEVARSLAESLGAHCHSLLVRTTATRSQAQTDHSDRLIGDLDDAFAVTADVPESVILCDDVYTSGATMDAAAKALKQAGVGIVWGFAVARG